MSTDEGGNIVPLDNPKKLPKTHLAYVWCNVAQQLALALRVDCDYVKRHFVCELYNSGYDAVAQEVSRNQDKVGSREDMTFNLGLVT